MFSINLLLICHKFKFWDEASTLYRLNIMYVKSSKSSYPNSTQLQSGHVVDTGSNFLHQKCILILNFKLPFVRVLQERYGLQNYCITYCCTEKSPFTKVAYRFKQKLGSMKLTTCLSIMSHIYSVAYVTKNYCNENNASFCMSSSSSSSSLLIGRWPVYSSASLHLFIGRPRFLFPSGIPS